MPESPVEVKKGYALELSNKQAMGSGARRLMGDFEDWEVLLACLEWGCGKGRLEEEVTEVGVGVLGDLPLRHWSLMGMC